LSFETARILVVEDNDTLRRGIARALRETGAEVDEVAQGERAVERLRCADLPAYDVILSDLRLPGADGVAVLRAARERDPRSSVLLMTAYGSIETAVEAMKHGAFDFVQKPLDLEQLELRVARGLAHRRLLREVSDLRAEQAARGGEGIVGDSPALRAALDLARRVAPSRSTVLITGETGTGKELIASLIHRASARADGPLVKVNCAAVPETLLESELFGHERGAFTGADSQRVGRFEEASGGTLFLDEIGEMSPATQAKLLRVLQDQEFHRLGGTRVLRTDARIVSATNREPEERIREGSLREDLFFRLNVIRIHLPPLRERPQDLMALARHFLEHFAREHDRPLQGFAEDALARIRCHPWPGNVRELRNSIERGVLMAETRRLRAADLGLGPPPPAAAEWTPVLPAEGVSLHDMERRLVLEALERSDWVQKRAAALLGISRRKLNYMVRKMGLTHPSWRRNRAGERPSGPAQPADDPA
jgi:DNA-binding NtrC family response regulator